MRPRPPTSADLPALLKLNNDHALELSEETPDGFASLLEVAWRVRVTDDLAGMCVAFDQDTRRDAQNLNWFKARYAKFVYIDRVVVAASARGRGLARRFYEDAMDAARAEGHTLMCAEINLAPPNPASDAFHASMGFEPIGQAKLDGDDKTVRYFSRKL